MTKPKHTPEPWPGIEPTHCHTRLIPVADYLRAVPCVNACAGLEDPAKAIEAARVALLNAEATLLDADGSSYHVNGDACLTKSAKAQRNSSLAAIAQALQLLNAKP